MWSEECVLDSQVYLCILEIPRLAIPPNWPPLQPIPPTPSPQLSQELPVTLHPQPNQVQMPQHYELMDLELDIPKDILDLLDVPQDVMSNFNTWVQDVLTYQW